MQIYRRDFYKLVLVVLRNGRSVNGNVHGIEKNGRTMSDVRLVGRDNKYYTVGYDIVC